MKKFKLLLASAAMLFACVLSYAQTITVSGTVKDSAGNPIPGVGVIISGSSRGTVSSDAGEYSLQAPADAALTFSALGFTTIQVPVNGRSVINVTLEEDSELLNETIVIGYGTSTKSAFTGSATMVKEEVIEKKINSNVTAALAGTTPGVQVITSSGDPAAGGSNTIRIRGYGSYQASNDPLIILDGAPYDGSISDINPQDVESMSVLKDASAAAIYGNRGANGVILITTKRGKAGEARVKFDARFGTNTRLIPNYDVITDPGQYYEQWFTKMYNSYWYSGHSEAESFAFANANLYDQNNGGLGYQVYTLPEGENLIGYNFKLNPHAKLGYSDGEYYYIPDDWYNETFHTGYRQEYNVSASGAAGRFNYYASAGYLKDGGIINNSNYERYTGRINAEYQAKDWIKLVTAMGFSHSVSESVSGAGSWGSSGNLFYLVNSIAPIYPLYVRKLDAGGNPYVVTDNGRIKYDSNNTNQVRASIVGNAIRDNENDSDCNIADVLTGKWGFVLTPLKGLSLTGNISITDDNTRNNSLSSVFGSAASVDGAASVSHSRFFSVNKQLLAEYKTTLQGVHNFDILAGYEGYSYTSQGLSGYNYHLFNPLIGELNNADDTPTSSQQLRSSTTQYATEGYLTRAQYDYDGKYFVNGSFRRDASSRFYKDARWGNFWSAGAAWLVSKEDFIQDIEWINMLKVKVSYGETGNDNIGSLFPYEDQYSHSYNKDTDSYSLSLTYKGNKDLTWETKQSLNAGVDFELFNGYLNGTLDLYSQTTKDLLYAKDVPLSSGNPTGQVLVNVGSLNNKGIELALDGSIVRTRNVQWTWNANASHNVNKMISLDDSVSEEGIKGSFRIVRVGGSLYEGYMWKYAGVDKETGEALYYKNVYEQTGVDEKGNPVYSDKVIGQTTTANFSTADKYDIGDFLPKLTGGFGTSLNAFGFDFAIQCSYQLGGRYYDGNYQALMHSQNNAGSALHKDILKAWTPENTDTNVPRWDGDTQVSQSAVDRFVISSNYLSLDNVSLGYTLPFSLTSKFNLSSVRFYVSGENLYVLSARQGVDPRFGVGLGGYTSGSGINQSYYSARRTITGGVTVMF